MTHLLSLALLVEQLDYRLYRYIHLLDLALDLDLELTESLPRC